MAFFNSNMIPELQELPASDREMIIQKLNWAIAESEEKTSIPLNYFRDEQELVVYNYDYTELYNAFKR